MATRQTVFRILIVALLAIAALIVLMVLFTWGVSTGGSGVG
jgi:ABC-type transporter Mla subunit MlaD